MSSQFSKKGKTWLETEEKKKESFHCKSILRKAIKNLQKIIWDNSRSSTLHCKYWTGNGATWLVNVYTEKMQATFGIFHRVLLEIVAQLYKHQWNTRIFPFTKTSYYINTSEIPSELSRENFISSHVKKTCYLHMWRDHRRYGYIINRAFE